MKVEKKVIEPERVIPEKSVIVLELEPELAEIIGFALRRAIEDRRELVSPPVARHLPYKKEVAASIEQVHEALFRLRPHINDALKYEPSGKQTVDPRSVAGDAGQETPKPLPNYTDYKAEDVLRIVVDFLNRDDKESARLWRILTALRGPDKEDDDSLKHATTAVIRYAVGIRQYANGAVTSADDGDWADLRKSLNDYERMRKIGGGHFIGHAKAAFDELGLEWDDLNYINQDKP